MRINEHFPVQRAMRAATKYAGAFTETIRKGYFVTLAADRFGESAATNCWGVTVPPEITDKLPLETERRALVPALALTVHPEKVGSVQPASNARLAWGTTALIAAT